jgi:dimethylaniline monooxygenase (N-oxide forming)
VSRENKYESFKEKEGTPVRASQRAAPRPPGRRRVAVIGAGASGLAATKCLLDEGLEPVVYEQRSEIGGLWNYHETLPDAGGVMYRSLHTNTSRHTLAFSDFPLPESMPDFLHHSQVLQYLREYAASFGLQRYIQFNTVVESVQPTEQWHWTIRARTEERSATETFDAVIICSGRDCSPMLPRLPGLQTFAGRLLHSSSYRGPEEFAGQDVVVAGVGSSGVDIAVELSQVARQVYLSTTRGAWFIPRYVLNRPYDHQLTRLAERLPYPLRLFFFSRLLLHEYKRMGADLQSLRAKGLPLPAFDLWRARLTPCHNALLLRIKSGAILIRPKMSRLEARQVVFADESNVEADTVVCCTGYRLRFPFLPEALLAIKDDRVELYKHVFHPDLPHLAFVGLCAVAGSHFPVAEIQGRWVARVLAGALELPSKKEMAVAIERYRSHPSHQSPVPMQVQLLEYADEIASILGVHPHIWRHLWTLPRWFFGPFSAALYRLDESGKKR